MFDHLIAKNSLCFPVDYIRYKHLNANYDDIFVLLYFDCKL